MLFCWNFTGLSWIILQMISELQMQRINFEEMLCLNLRQIFLVINRYLKENRNIGTGMLNEVEKATHYFNENFTKNISIEDYAAEHGMTANWFTQNFRKITKYTPIQYMINLRRLDSKNRDETI